MANLNRMLSVYKPVPDSTVPRTGKPRGSLMLEGTPHAHKFPTPCATVQPGFVIMDA